VATGITRLIGVLVNAQTLLTAAIVCSGAAGADPNQDEHFLELLREKQIPALDNVPELIGRAHEICGELDGGTPFAVILGEETNIMSGGSSNPGVDAARVNTTAVRFIDASVGAYCPGQQDKLP
jgi:hypothetical protein